MELFRENTQHDAEETERHYDQIGYAEEKIQGVDAVVNYPVISGLANAEAQAEINKVLKENASGVITGAEGNAEEFPPSESSFPYEFSGDFVVHYNQNDILSITAYDYSYTGGAHGMTFRKSFTFSLKDGKQMKLGDFINMQGKNKQKLNNLVLNKLKKKEATSADLKACLPMLIFM